MTAEVWLAIVGFATAVVGTVKYAITKFSESNDKAIEAHKAHLKSFQTEIATIRKEYYDTLTKVEAAKVQMVLAQKDFSENNKHLKLFIELTKTYIQDTEKRMKLLEDNFGRVILKLK